MRKPPFAFMLRSGQNGPGNFTYFNHPTQSIYLKFISVLQKKIKILLSTFLAVKDG